MQRSMLSPTPTGRNKVISILQWNIHGVTSKAASLMQYVHTHDTAVIVLQETLSSDASNMRLGKYQLFKKKHINKEDHEVSLRWLGEI